MIPAPTPQPPPPSSLPLSLSLSLCLPSTAVVAREAVEKEASKTASQAVAASVVSSRPSDCQAAGVVGSCRRAVVASDMDVDQLVRQLDEKEAELLEFQESSRELEQELQKQLELSEKRNRELLNSNYRLRQDLEEASVKFARERQQLESRVEELTQELESEKSRSKTLVDGIRHLEQMNDDLERSKRTLAATLESFERDFNSQLEKNVLLESELGEKSELEGMIQRLKDEARELREELMVQQQKRVSISESTSHSSPAQRPSSVRLASPVVVAGSRSPVGGCSGLPVRQILPPNPPLSSHTHGNSHHLRNNNHILNSSSLTAKSPPLASPPSSSAASPSCRSPLASPAKTATAGNGLSNGGASRDPPATLMSPNTRNSALNIVSDLLRKVGDLESKLASCRNIVPPACRAASDV